MTFMTVSRNHISYRSVEVLIMAAFNKKVILYAAIGVMIANRQSQLFKKKQVKRFWRRGIFSDRKLYSEYFTLYQQLRNGDEELHYRYLRMSKGRFDHLMSLIREKIKKKDTRLREAISAEERLVIINRNDVIHQILCAYSFIFSEEKVIEVTDVAE